jgi:CxxC motif-containing protein (DUF1111 family)
MLHYLKNAIIQGRALFDSIGCATCHIPALPLSRRSWVFTEPNPYNPPKNLREGEAPTFSVDLTSSELPQPRLTPEHASDHEIMIPIFSDFKLHDITDPASNEDMEPLDMNHGPWSPGFTKGNRRFLTYRLWGSANEPPYFHHGLFTTLREAVLAHHGEALMIRKAFEALEIEEKNAIIEFLKSLQVLPPDTAHRVVDEKGQQR